MIYNSSQNYTGKLIGENGKPLIGQHISLNLTCLSDGTSKIYWVTTDVNGEYQLPINLYNGEYTAQCSYSGTSQYASSNTSNSITVY